MAKKAKEGETSAAADDQAPATTATEPAAPAADPPTQEPAAVPEPEPPAKPKVTTKPQAAKATVKEVAAKEPEFVPEAGLRKDAATIDLLLDACERFGVNPEVDCRPRELAAWRFYQGSRLDGRPDAVVIVTQGGVKLMHYADPDYPQDPDTEATLRTIFKAFTIGANKELVPTALPEKQILPEEVVTGLVKSTAHVHQRGYLRRKKD